MSKSHILELKISRYFPETKESAVHAYNVKAGELLRFADVLRKINEEQDPTLTWSSSCEHGMCGSCGIRINGRPVLVCQFLVGDAMDLFKTTTLELKPLSVAPVIRDLVVDLEKSYERIRVIKPFIIETAPLHPEGNEYRIAPELLRLYENATRCIYCFCCADACLSRRSSFLGPNAIQAAVVRLMDPREMARDERMKIVYGDRGVVRCHTSRACSHVCPKEIDVAHFIALAKEGVLGKPDGSA